MDTYVQSRTQGLVVLTLLLLATMQPAMLQAQTCGGQIPARHVPGPPPNHDPAAPDVNLWLPDIFRPGLTGLPNRQLPAERDSTIWDSIKVPSCATGQEIFQSMDVAGDHLYVAYNAGFSIWDISGANAEDPQRIKVRDGLFCGGSLCQVECSSFLSFPGSGEVDFLVEDIDVLPEPGTNNVYIAVSGRNPVGISLWRFNTNTRGLAALYQDTTRVSRQVRLVSVSGRIYAFSAYGNGLAVYDLTRSLDINPCLQENAADCSGVYRGNVGSISTGRFLDVLLRPTGELLVTATDGQLNNRGLELWQVNDPSNPGTAIQLFNGLDEKTFGTALFNYEGNDYVAAVERNGSVNTIKIFNITSCTVGSCSLGAPVFSGVSVPPFISDQFLTYSTSQGRPFLYYGLFAGLTGPKVEQLLDLTTLGRPVQNITEVTDGGPTYFDTCVQQDLGYWAWYYPGNEFGPNNLSPRVGKFDSSSGIFYRAAGGILDVHVWTPRDATTTTTVSNPDPQGLYWMGDEVTFQGAGAEGCTPNGIWTWTPTTPPDVDAITVSEAGNQITYRFECNLSTDDRCNDAMVSVSGANSAASCAGAEQIATTITVKDPRVDITSINPSGGTFSQCNNVNFTAGLVGRGPVDLEWTARRDSEIDPQQTLADTIGNEDLSTASPMFTWNTAAAMFAGIFTDGFESGNTSAWGQPPMLAEDFTIEVAAGGGPNATAMVELTSCNP